MSVIPYIWYKVVIKTSEKEIVNNTERQSIDKPVEKSNKFP